MPRIFASRVVPTHHFPDVLNRMSSGAAGAGEGPHVVTILVDQRSNLLIELHVLYAADEDTVGSKMFDCFGLAKQVGMSADKMGRPARDPPITRREPFN